MEKKVHGPHEHVQPRTGGLEMLAHAHVSPICKIIYSHSRPPRSRVRQKTKQRQVEKKSVGWAHFLKNAKPNLPNCWRMLVFQLPKLVFYLAKHKICQTLFSKHLKMLLEGKERTEETWHKIFLDAGFTRYKITPIIGTTRSLIEVYP